MEENLGRISDFDVVRSAELMVEQHGAEAPVHAAIQADRLMTKGAYAGFHIWFRIMRATIDLLRSEPGEGETIN